MRASLFIWGFLHIPTHSCVLLKSNSLILIEWKLKRKVHLICHVFLTHKSYCCLALRISVRVAFQQSVLSPVPLSGPCQMSLSKIFWFKSMHAIRPADISYWPFNKRFITDHFPLPRSTQGRTVRSLSDHASYCDYSTSGFYQMKYYFVTEFYRTAGSPCISFSLQCRPTVRS